MLEYKFIFFKYYWSVMIEKTTATDRFKEYLKDANHFELEDAWKLFKEAGREHYTYKKQEKFLVSIIYFGIFHNNMYLCH